jgi:leucyl aminopeptidase
MTETRPSATAHLVESAEGAVEIVPLAKPDLEAWLERAQPAEAAWVRALGFAGEAGKTAVLPAAEGGLGRALVGVERAGDLWSYAGLPFGLPAGTYRLAEGAAPEVAEALALGWAIGGYRFARYKTKEGDRPAELVWPAGADTAEVARRAESVWLVRDLVNTPAEDMGPADLEATARGLADAYGAELTVTAGDDLLTAGYPAIHAVGRAAGAGRAPRLIDLGWTGDASGPLIALVGKGVCFDTGGLDLKSAANMKLMKKDMGGAAHVLGLARLVMDARLPVRLRMLIPAVENAVSGESFRPLDVLTTRQGLTVEVGDTDAEGRLILCDAIAEAVAQEPDLLLDMATLTGAARVALGTELPALFCNSDPLAEAALAAGRAEDDPVWRLPLHAPYRRHLESKVADISNIGGGGFGGAITAALFLERFVPEGTPWIHLDLMSWNTAGRPGRPEGGEAQALRSLWTLLRQTADRGGWRA